ncbi:hypothetical protein IQ251_12885 [Saccharopolyspora sp. HNM0983]|uniref:Membrane protein YfhO n=1 Tax=Saccharopolyspora montiporae TaxID=2781240 RepID=A0A929BC68_9PSEU|nr:hypothetical protein [Saccharopolyspora sp. HNM0983]MBE9375341.1 hypothetical protein [Saccharopolyspora sp. HNM0983]
MVTHSVAADPAETTTAPAPRSGRDRGRLAAPMVTCLLVAAMAQLPVLRPGWFYFADDSANQILPMWYHLGHQIRDGVWPPVLDPDLLMGGNLAAETLFGVWNPANALVWVGVSFAADLGVAGIVVRTVALALIGLGCYLVCREYGAGRWPASAVATALPLTGSLLYYDAAKWPAALLAFLWVPYVWVAARRMLRGRTNAVWVFLLGFLAVTAGNPYGLLGVVVVLGALLVEAGLQRHWSAARRLLLVSVAIGTVVPLVYLPLVRTTHMTWRTPGGVSNSGDLTPHLGDLLQLSMPTYVPDIPEVGVPAVYFCWFAVPLAFWCDWSVLRRRWRELSGVFAVAAVYLLVAIGPSEVWMFRWPLRVVHYGYLAAAVLLAVVLTAGLRLDRWRVRAAGTTLFLLLTVYFTTARLPEPATLRRAGFIVLVIGFLIAAAVLAYRKRGTGRMVAVLQIGTMLTFCAQAVWFIGGGTELHYFFPSSPKEMRENYAGRYEGRVLQIADTALNGDESPDGPREVWRDMAVGNAFLPSGVDSVGSYTGLGFNEFTDVLCMRYEGSSCPEAYGALWRPPQGAQAPLADLLLLDTVVVQHKLIAQPAVPEGWHVADRTERVSVLRRDEPASATDGHLSWNSPNIRPNTDVSVSNTREVVDVERTTGEPGRLVFAKLAWPGYTATFNGAEVPIRAGPAGLLEVVLPAGQDGSGQLELTWSPPSMRLGLAAAACGALLAAGVGLQQIRARRRDGIASGAPR